MEFTHLNEDGRGRMVNLADKADTHREAIASGRITLQSETIARIREGSLAKGDVLGIAQIAGIMAAKKTPDLIPLCHNILLRGVDLSFDITSTGVAVQATIHTQGPTGAEMEALTAVSAALLTIYDMCKAIDKTMEIQDICLLRKTGGKSGTFERDDKTPDRAETET